MLTPPGLEFRDRAVYVPASRTLVLADLHIGRARTAGIEAPVERAAGIHSRLRALLASFEPARVVIAGDVLDAFRRVPPGVADRFRAIVECVESTGAALVVLRGNHDGMLESIYAGRLRDTIILDETLIAHGDAEPTASATRYVIGHEHPAIRIEGVKRPCYLYGPNVWAGADVLVLPAFTPLVRGTVMNRRRASDCHAPILQAGDLDRYRPIVRDEAADDTLTFPRFGSLRSHL